MGLFRELSGFICRRGLGRRFSRSRSRIQRSYSEERESYQSAAAKRGSEV
jgi:hypothetical protein